MADAGMSRRSVKISAWARGRRRAAPARGSPKFPTPQRFGRHDHRSTGPKPELMVVLQRGERSDFVDTALECNRRRGRRGRRKAHNRGERTHLRDLTSAEQPIKASIWSKFWEQAFHGATRNRCGLGVRL